MAISDRNLNNSDGSLNQSTQGSISEGTQSLGTTGTWGFINTGNPTTSIGQSQSLSHRTQRHYASEFILSSTTGSAINTTYGSASMSPPSTTTTTPRLQAR